MPFGSVRRRSFLLGTSALGIGAALGLLRTPVAAADVQATPGELVADVITTHPRLLLTDFTSITDKVAAVPRVAAWSEQIVAQADALLPLPVQEYEIPDGRRMTHAPVIQRAYVLALSHQVTGDARYAERLWAELDGAAAWPDWNPSHFLDTAGMTHAFAIGLDWMHEYWTSAQRDLLAATIVSKGLEPGLQEYADGAFWTRAAHNWNAVCNGGLTMGALAVAHEYPELAGDLIAKGLVAVPKAADEYAPDGGYPEGTGYWSYGTGYLVKYLASLISASGGANGIEDKPGLAETGYFPIDLTGTSGQAFNYYDSGGASPRSTEFFWLAAQHGQPALTDWAAGRADLSAEVTDVIWFDPTHSQPGAERWRDRALDHHYTGVQVVTSRASWAIGDGAFVGVKGGANATNHSDLDLGTFVLDALGARWAVDLGADDYNLPGYFASGVDGERWQYYRKRTEGQNTLVAAPSLQGGQGERAQAHVVRHEHLPEEVITVVDLGEATPALTAWRRGIRLLDQRREIVVQDEFTCADATDVWWFMHTTARVDVADDGRSATLTHGADQVLLRILGGGAQTFVHTPAAPLWTSPLPAGQDVNAGVSKLAIRSRAVTEGVLAVQVSAVRAGERTRHAQRREPLDRWRLGREGFRLGSLLVDGDPLPEFRPDVFHYTVTVPEASTRPRVTGSARGRLRVAQAREVPGTAVLLVGAGPKERAYTVRFETAGSADLQPGQVVVASSHDGNLPENVLDGDLQTRWSAQGGGQWIRLDLGDVVPVDSVALAWHQGAQRSALFSVEVSDGAEWTSVLTDQRSALSADVQVFSFAPVQARYVRYTGYGNTTNMWNSVTEFAVPGHPVTLPEPPVRLDRVEVTVPVTLNVGTTAEVEAAAYLTDGTPVDASRGDWELLALDEQVATITPDGEVTAVAVGATRVVATVELDHELRWAVAELTVVDPSTQLLTTDADAFVRSGTYADANTGRTTTLALKNDTAPNYHREAYLRFPAPAPGTVESAELELTARISDGTPSATVGVFETGADWEENSLTWNTRPPMAAQLGALTLSGELVAHTVDVTEYVRAALAAGGPIAFGLQQVLTGTERGVNINVNARESGTPARLRIHLG